MSVVLGALARLRQLRRHDIIASLVDARHPTNDVHRLTDRHRPGPLKRLTKIPQESISENVILFMARLCWSSATLAVRRLSDSDDPDGMRVPGRRRRQAALCVTRRRYRRRGAIAGAASLGARHRSDVRVWRSRTAAAAQSACRQVAVGRRGDVTAADDSDPRRRTDAGLLTLSFQLATTQA